MVVFLPILFNYRLSNEKRSKKNVILLIKRKMTFTKMETVGLEANGLEKKPLFKALFGDGPSHPESPITKT